MNKNKTNKAFTVIELTISIGMIVILSGVVLINYNLQKDKMDLNNAANIVVQEVRKAQALAMNQSARPDGSASQNFAIHFSQNNNYVSLYGDKDINPYESEKRYFPNSIKIYHIDLSNNSNFSTFTTSPNASLIFNIKDLSTIIKSALGTNFSYLRITLCIRSANICDTQSTKRIKINSKGLVEIQ
jgi:type II secretory pathway pseudopilin PulG